MKLTSNTIGSLGTILGIWAHPDDESWFSGGVMATAAAAGQRVVCVSATAGENGNTSDESRWPAKSLREIRSQELDNALGCLGDITYKILGFPDGGLSKMDQDKAVSAIVLCIQEYKPDCIITFEPGGVTGHDDHKTVSDWSVAAVRQTKSSIPVYGAIELQSNYESFGKILDKKFDIYFNTPKPNVVTEDQADLSYKLPEAVLEKKLSCLQSLGSQTAGMFEDPEMAKWVRMMAQSEQFILLM
jgi:LmbE family N-acetylglucosaminyl deacetylase